MNQAGLQNYYTKAEKIYRNFLYDVVVITSNFLYGIFRNVKEFFDFQNVIFKPYFAKFALRHQHFF